MRRVALTGTPGTGKSSVARRLGIPGRQREVYELGAGRRPGAPTRRRTGERRRTYSIDLAAAARFLRSPAGDSVEVVVGHLAHLLPIRDVIVLRCHPRVLARRLARSRRVPPADLRENLLAEATDVILVEALDLGRRVWEIDTTDRSPASVAEEVARRRKRRGRPAYGRVDWLADPWVTEHLLEWSR